MKDNSMAGFEQLALQAANNDLPLRIDVTDRVLNTLQSGRAELAFNADAAIFCTMSLVAANLALVVSWIGFPDNPLTPMIQPFVSVLP